MISFKIDDNQDVNLIYDKFVSQKPLTSGDLRTWQIYFSAAELKNIFVKQIKRRLEKQKIKVIEYF